MRQTVTRLSEEILQHRKKPVFWIMVVVTLIIAAVNIATRIDDHASIGHLLDWRNPVITEYSSALMIILLMPFLFTFFDHSPLTRQNWARPVPLYIIASLVFSAVHISGMVFFRSALWPLVLNGDYEFFGHWFWTSFYEYRKDLITFLILLFIYLLDKQRRQAKINTRQPTPIALKSGATTILLHPGEFLYAKSAGNYAEITSVSGTQLARITLKALADKLNEGGCDAARIHRSCIVNRSTIMETSPIAGGDLMVKLKSGESFRASRRYRESLP